LWRGFGGKEILIMNGGGIARLSVLAAGLGIGAVVASAGASADSSDWLSSIDAFLSGVAVPAADSSASGLNLAISIDGVSLLQQGTAYAYTGSNGDIAIDNGSGATAYAIGTYDYAAVDGTGSSAAAGGYNAAQATGSNDNTAFVFGDGSHAFAGGSDGNPGTFDYAVIFGNNDTALAGGDAAGAGSYDGAYVEGNNLGVAHAQGADYLADILKFYGDGTTSSTAAAAESGNFLSELWSAADATGAAESGNLVSDLLGSFDPTTAAAESTNFLSELASLF
jgi:hypothetical protein